MTSVAAYGQADVMKIRDCDTLVQPGSSQTLVYRLQNLTDSQIVIGLENKFTLPLRPVLCPRQITLDSGQSKNILVTFSVPKFTRPGISAYSLVFKFMDNPIYTGEGQVKVAKISNLNLKVIKLPEYGRAGDKIDVVYLLTNEGNGEESLQLQSLYAVIDGPKELKIPADSTVYIHLHSFTLKDLKYPYDQSFDLKLMNPNGDWMNGIQKSVKIYPTRVVKNDPYHRYPILISSSFLTRYVNEVRQVSTYQFEINGNGSLDSAGDHRIEFLYRGPDQQQVARVGRFSQKYLGYVNPRMSVYAGERSFTSNMLTDMFRFGNGASVEYKPGLRSSVTAYYVIPRFLSDVKSVSSLLGKWDKSDLWQFQGGLLAKQMNDGKIIWLQNISTEFAKPGIYKGLIEMATAYNAGPATFAGHANYELSKSKIRWNSDVLYASPKYPGYFNNTLTFNQNASYYFNNLRFQAGWNYSDANPKQDTVYGIAPVSNNLNAGFGYGFKNKSTLSFYYVYRVREDRFEPRQFNFSENAVRGSYTYSRTRFGFNWNGEIGNTRNYLLPKDANQSKSLESQINLNFHNQTSFNINVVGQFLRNIRFTSVPVNYLIYGGSVSLRVKKKLSMALQYQNTFLIDELFQDRNLFDARISYKITENQSLSLYGNYAILFNSNQSRDFYGLASYNLQLNVPTRKIATFGSVYGTIDNQAGGKKEGILLFIGANTAITNKDGHFLFNNIKPGIYPLMMERGSIGVNEIPDTTFPIMIEVQPAIKTQVTLRIVKTVSFSGKASLVEKTKVVQASGNVLSLPQLVIEFSNGEQTFLTTTSPDGRFSYLGLRPGKWTVRVIPTSWTQDFTIEKQKFDFVMEPGQSQEVKITVMPKVRQIKFKNSAPVEIKK